MSSVEEEDQESGLNVAHLLDALIRRRWLIIGTACAIALATIGVTFKLPNQYTSEATILVDAQKVSERYVVPTTSADVNQALEAMEHEVLSRPRLLAIIDELGLYPKEKERLTPEELIGVMRRNLLIEPLFKPGQTIANTFQISFTASTAPVAQQVTARLSTLFIEQNLKTRSEQAITTTTFLHEQLQLTKNKLTEQEERLRDFKMQYLGELPEQQQGNVGILTGLEVQLDNVMSNQTQAQQQRLYLQSLLNDHRRVAPRGSGTPTITSTGEVITPLDAAARELARLQSERRTMLSRYTAQHPDVLKKDQEVKLQQEIVSELRSAKSASPTPVAETQSAPVESAPEESLAVSQLNSQLRSNTFETENLAKKEQKLRAEIEQYRSRLNLTPVREQQLTSMQRDYELLRQHYGELLRKEQESQLATNLEKRQEGQQFRLADPANLPSRPSSPKRIKISLIGLVAGIALGCALALAAEFRNPVFHTEHDVTARFAGSLVIGVPAFSIASAQRKRSWTKMFEWAAASVLVAVVAAAEFYVYRHG